MRAGPHTAPANKREEQKLQTPQPKRHEHSLWNAPLQAGLRTQLVTRHRLDIVVALSTLSLRTTPAKKGGERKFQALQPKGLEHSLWNAPLHRGLRLQLPPKTASTWLAIKKKKGSCKSLSRASSVVNATGHPAPPRHLESSVSTVSDSSAPHANKGKRKDAPKPCSQRGMSIVSGMFVALYKRCLAGKCQNPRLPGRSIMTGHLHICLLDIPSACGLLSTWQAQCQKHL